MITSFHLHCWAYLNCLPFRTDPVDKLEIPLLERVQELVFSKSCLLILGRIPKEYPDIISRFNQFDELFELASSDIPHTFLPKFTGTSTHLAGGVSATDGCFIGAQSYLLGILRRVAADYFANPQQNNIEVCF